LTFDETHDVRSVIKAFRSPLSCGLDVRQGGNCGIYSFLGSLRNFAIAERIARLRVRAYVVAGSTVDLVPSGVAEHVVIAPSGLQGVVPVAAAE
jgi:hypothetical protein